jgi:hypothetical protein
MSEEGSIVFIRPDLSKPSRRSRRLARLLGWRTIGLSAKVRALRQAKLAGERYVADTFGWR